MAGRPDLTGDLQHFAQHRGMVWRAPLRTLRRRDEGIDVDD